MPKHKQIQEYVSMDKIELPQAVFWDWDGTLVDSYGFLNDAHNHTLTQLGFPPFEEGEYKNYFGKPRDILYPAIYKDKHVEAIDVFQEYVVENSHTIKTLPDSLHILDFFHDKDIAMGIVSNKRADLIKKEVKHHQWDKFFDVIVGAGDASEDKPSGAPLELALEKANIKCDKDDIWYIGDTENDLACAQNVGCHSLFLEGVENSNELIEKYKPLKTFKTYLELKEFLVAI